MKQAWWLVVGLLVAGCADGGTAPGNDETFEGLEPASTAKGKGVLRGVVIDATITPIAEAKVKLNSGQETQTNENGAFLFSDLDPGHYFVTASKVGYATVQSSMQVEADVERPPILRIQLEKVPGSEPRVVTHVTSGYIGCSFKVANIVFRNQCGPPTNLDPDKFETISFGEEEMPDVVQSEISWTSTQTLGNWLSVIQFMDGGAGGGRMGNVWGPSPVVCRVTQEAQCDNGDGTGGGGAGMNTTGWTDAINVNVYASCTNGCIIGAVGYGLVLQQDYDMFVTVFYNIDPAEDWTFVGNGPYPVPSG